jgi:hypothetical protein
MNIDDSKDSVQVSSASGEKDWFRVDLDSHANTCCVGSGVLIVNQMDWTACVSPFLKSLGSVSKVPIASAAIAYDHPSTGEVFVLVIHQALQFTEMTHCLLCPMQLRLNDVVVNKQPKFLTTKPTKIDYAIVFGELLIPLDLHGVTSYFHGRTPTKTEYDNCNRIELTSPDPEWRPHDEMHAEEEALHNSLYQEQSRHIVALHDEENFENNLYDTLCIRSYIGQSPL